MGRATRSIPARAGEPSPVRGSPVSETVYPRACGGTSASRWVCPAMRGLSPRVRGNHGDKPRELDIIWSIPARAGEPTAAPPPPRSAWVYPRACGGTSSPAMPVGMVLGLSPRVRGNHNVCPQSAAVLGSIPARAGEPVDCGMAYAIDGVYPRACGGTPSAPAPTVDGRGLSPRVRGNRTAGVRSGARLRSIPARAGEPGRRRRRT